MELKGRKARELVALLACEKGRLVSKRRICSLLWDTEPELAMDSLSKVCRGIKAFSREHGSCIPLSVTYGAICLDLGGVSCDLIDFDLLCRQEDPGSWKNAASLYTGALLSNESFGWAQEYEGRYEIAYLELCEKLAVHYRTLGKGRLAQCYEKILEL